MDPGIKFTVYWSEPSAAEVTATCSNGCFSGSAELYLNPTDLPHLAGVLRGFPANADDERQAELGTFDPESAGGGIKMRFCGRDPQGHCVVSVQLRGGRYPGISAAESVSLTIPIEPAGLDSFVSELVALASEPGCCAYLPMAK